MWKYLLIGCSFSAPLLGQTPNITLVSATERSWNLSDHGFFRSDCIKVYQDGRIHLERRANHPSHTTLDSLVFDFKLTSDELKCLCQILSAAAVANLESLKLPTYPMGISTLNTFEVEIPRGSTAQDLGYFEWPDKQRPVSPNTTPDEIKQAWQTSKAALELLLLWFHSIEAMQVQPSGGIANSCG